MLQRWIRKLRDFDYGDLRFLYVACLATIAVVYTVFRVSEHLMSQQEMRVLTALQTLERQGDRAVSVELQAEALRNHRGGDDLIRLYADLLTQHSTLPGAIVGLRDACQARPCGNLFDANFFNIPSDEALDAGASLSHRVASYRIALHDGAELAIRMIGAKDRIYSVFDVVSYVCLIVLLLLQAVYVFRPAIRRLNASLSVRSDFLSRISHEIRNPMNSILGMADILKGTRLNYEQQQYVDNLIRSGHALLDMLNNLIDFSSIEGGKLALKPAPFDLFASLDRCINLISIPAHHKNMNVYLLLSPGLCSNLVGDSMRLEQVLINLLNNAVKFTEKGHISLRLEVEADTATETQLRFSVEDTGIGIKQEQLGEIFESFVQADSSIQRRYGGSGLGLSISSELIRLMGGTLQVTSQLGEGSRFFFSVRFAKGTQEQPLAKLADCKFIFVGAPGELPPYEKVFAATNAPVEFWPNAREFGVALNRQPRAATVTEVLLDDSLGIISMINARNLSEGAGLGDRTVALIRSNFTKENMDLLRRNGFTRFLIKPLKPWALLNLPLGTSTENEDESKPSSGHTGVVGKLREKNLRLLLVDDSNDNLFLLKEVVEPLASTIHFAENGLEAIGKFRENTYDAVFMDIQMPVMDGYTAIRKMREIETGSRHTPVPIYAVTAHAGLVDAQKCREAGFTDRIVKPVVRGDIYRQLSKSFSLEISESEESETLPEKYLARLMPTYLKTRAEDMVKLNTALATKDFQAIAQLGHKIKGSAASYGFPIVSDMSKSLENAAHASDIERCADLARQLGEMFEAENRKLKRGGPDA